MSVIASHTALGYLLQFVGTNWDFRPPFVRPLPILRNPFSPHSVRGSVSQGRAVRPFLSFRHQSPFGHTYPLLFQGRAVRFTYNPINGLTGRLLFSREIRCIVRAVRAVPSNCNQSKKVRLFGAGLDSNQCTPIPSGPICVYYSTVTIVTSSARLPVL